MKVLLFIRRVLDFVFVIARRKPISDIVSLRIGESLALLKVACPILFFLKKEGGEHNFKWGPSFAHHKVGLRLLARDADATIYNHLTRKVLYIYCTPVQASRTQGKRI